MVFKQTISLSDLRSKAQMTGEITRQLIIKTSNFSIFFSVFMANSTGKDKFIALFQYLFQFFCVCGKHSSIAEMALAYRKHELPDMVVYYQLKENLSSARKVFRLFRFFDDVKGLSKVLKTNKPRGFKVLSVMTYFCSIMYYVSDNILWFLSILVRSQVIEPLVSRQWKQRKNFFSLWRVIAYSCILIYSILLQHGENTVAQEFLRHQTPQTEDIPAENTAYQQLIDGRRKTRFHLLELMLSSLRFLMLTQSLKLKGHEYLDPIFVGLCGLISSVLDFFKTVTEKKIVINLGQEEEKPGSTKRMEPKVKPCKSLNDW